MLDRVRARLRRHDMIAPGQRIGVAVSGGADSVCLLHVLRELAPELTITLAVLHLNHRLRGGESDEDARFVEELAASLGLPCYSESLDVAALGGNLEQAGRDARLAFFRRLRSQGVLDRIATGHTRSDQAETVLYRLLRGAGTAGLSGILPVTGDGLVRPLLDCTRADVLEHLRQNRLSWREDSSNLDSAFARNRIRHHLLPLLESEYSPAAVHILGATADVAHDEEDFWSQEIAARAPELFIRRGGAVHLRAAGLLDVHPALARRLVRKAISEVKGNLREIDIVHVDRILELAAQPEGHGRLQAPGIDVFRSFEWLRISPPPQGTRWDRDYSFPLELAFPVRMTLPGGNSLICMEVPEEADQPGGPAVYNGDTSELDQDLLCAPLELRNWHPGDELEAPGKSRQKIKFLFQEARIPIWDRQAWPVITSAGTIVWTRQFGASAKFARTGTTTRVLRIYEIGAQYLVDPAGRAKTVGRARQC